MPSCQIPCAPDVKRFLFWEVGAKKPLYLRIGCPDDKKGPVLDGMGKDIVGMEPPVGKEHRERSAAGDMPVSQLATCGKLISFPHGLDDCVGIDLIQQVIQRDEVHLVIAFLRASAGVVIAFCVLWVPCKGEA